MKKRDPSCDVFLSYRRDGGFEPAMLLKNCLEKEGYTVFLDYEVLGSGHFNTKIYEFIDKCKDFILVLPPNALDRCENKNDWVRLEIERALAGKKNIVPVRLRGFDWPEVLPESLEEIRTLNAPGATDEYFEAFIHKLTEFLISKPKPKVRRYVPAAALLAAAAVAFLLIRNPPQPRDSAETAAVPAPSAPAVSEVSPTPSPAASEAPLPVSWENNLMTQDVILPKDDPTLAAEEKVFKKQVLRKEIGSVFFFDTTSEAPQNAWDLSEKGDRSVLGWIVKTESGLFDLFIAGEGGVCAPQDCSGLFNGYINVSRIEFNNAFHTDHVTNMESMFFYCPTLTSLDLSGFDTSSVTKMTGMFCHSSGLKSIRFGEHFDVSNVESMTSMFFNCESLQQLDLSGFRTSDKLTSVYGMFNNCHELKKLDVSMFETKNVEHFGRMFSRCGSLTEINLQGLDTVNAVDMSYMFYECRNLVSLDLSSFRTPQVTNMQTMFCHCDNLTELDLHTFDTSKVKDMSYMFAYCSSLRSLDLGTFDTRSTENMAAMFGNCTALENLNVSSFHTEEVTDMSYMFNKCTSLKQLDISNFNMEKVEKYDWFVPDGLNPEWRSLFEK